MRSGIYFNNLSLIMFEVLAIAEFATVTTFADGKEETALFPVQLLLASGTHIEYLGEL